MFLKMSSDVHERVRVLYAAADEPERARVKRALEQALLIAWDRLGPAAEFEVNIGDLHRTLRRGAIEMQDLDAALTHSSLSPHPLTGVGAFSPL